jgi:hypothetical protein
MTDKLDTQRQIQAMLDHGWKWRDHFQQQLVHPADHSLSVFYDRAADELRVSPALAAALELVIPTPRGKSPRFGRP